MLRYLSAADFVRALPMADAIEAMRQVFADVHAGAVDCPPRTAVVAPPEGGRESLYQFAMPASWRGHGFGAKVSTFIADNPAHGHPAVQGLAVLLDLETGAPRLVVDAAGLTSRRTAAMAGLATDRLAPPEASALGVIGTGALGPEMVEAVRAVRPIGEVRLCNRTRSKAEELAASLEGVEAAVLDDPNAVAEASTVLVLATPSPTPVVADGAIPSGTHLNAVGNFSLLGREVEGATVGRSDIWVDTWEGAEQEAGELTLAAQEGLIAPGREGIRGELADLAVGDRPRRRTDLTLFKSVGTAISDVAAMVAALPRAEREGLGIELG